MTTLTINVVGTPAPQGSKKGFVNPRNGRVILTESSKKVKPWRQDVVAAIKDQVTSDWTVPAAAVEVELVFYIARPGYHYGTGKNASRLKPAAPAYVDKKPDSDKLARSTLDALTTSRVIRDDAQVARLIVEKRYADAATGARITITPLTGPPVPSPVAGTGPSPVSLPTAGEATPAHQEVLFT